MPDNDVLSVIEREPPDIREGLMELRRLILETAAETDGSGKVVETLKWGQPSYLTEKPKSGTTIRIAKDGSELGDIALYVSCNTSLVSEWRGLFPDLIFGGDRSLHLSLAKPLPLPELRQMIRMALTYHSRKKSR
ncbi:MULTISPECIES: DUF1801 domain-containing protein [unclassified Roseibium]|uniref:DUF1801 domain-containing protein n=1 Tax=unclassified Roseibium TaxID=2629323 RepID=UPI00273FCD09|nr:MULTISPECIES: DUF1801 domain-containing protein [unclassified Roseibium]